MPRQFFFFFLKRKLTDEVDARPLLHHLQRSTQYSSSEIGGRVSERTRETSGPRVKVASGGDKLRLELVICHNLSELLLDVSRVLRLTSDSRQGSSGSVESSLLDEESRRVGKEEKTGTEDQGPSKLNCNGDSVRTSVSSVLGTVDDTRGEQESDGDGELVTRHNGTSNLSWGDLTHVQDDGGRDETDTETGDQSTGNDQTELSIVGGLEDTSDDEDGATGNDGGSSTVPVGDIGGNDGTEESTGRQDGGDEGDFPGGDGVVVKFFLGSTDGRHGFTSHLVFEV